MITTNILDFCNKIERIRKKLKFETLLTRIKSESKKGKGSPVFEGRKLADHKPNNSEKPSENLGKREQEKLKFAFLNEYKPSYQTYKEDIEDEDEIICTGELDDGEVTKTELPFLIPSKTISEEINSGNFGPIKEDSNESEATGKGSCSRKDGSDPMKPKSLRDDTSEFSGNGLKEEYSPNLSNQKKKLSLTKNRHATLEVLPSYETEVPKKEGPPLLNYMESTKTVASKQRETESKVFVKSKTTVIENRKHLKKEIVKDGNDELGGRMFNEPISRPRANTKRIDMGEDDVVLHATEKLQEEDTPRSFSNEKAKNKVEVENRAKLCLRLERAELEPELKERMKALAEGRDFELNNVKESVDVLATLMEHINEYARALGKELFNIQFDIQMQSRLSQSLSLLRDKQDLGINLQKLLFKLGSSDPFIQETFSLVKTILSRNATFLPKLTQFGDLVELRKKQILKLRQYENQMKEEKTKNDGASGSIEDSADQMNGKNSHKMKSVLSSSFKYEKKVSSLGMLHEKSLAKKKKNNLEGKTNVGEEDNSKTVIKEDSKEENELVGRRDSIMSMLQTRNRKDSKTFSTKLNLLDMGKSDSVRNKSASKTKGVSEGNPQESLNESLPEENGWIVPKNRFQFPSPENSNSILSEKSRFDYSINASGTNQSSNAPSPESKEYSSKASSLRKKRGEAQDKPKSKFFVERRDEEISNGDSSADESSFEEACELQKTDYKDIMSFTPPRIIRAETLAISVEDEPEKAPVETAMKTPRIEFLENLPQLSFENTKPDEISPSKLKGLNSRSNLTPRLNHLRYSNHTFEDLPSPTKKSCERSDKLGTPMRREKSKIVNLKGKVTEIT